MRRKIRLVDQDVSPAPHAMKVDVSAQMGGRKAPYSVSVASCLQRRSAICRTIASSTVRSEYAFTWVMNLASSVGIGSELAIKGPLPTVQFTRVAGRE